MQPVAKKKKRLQKIALRAVDCAVIAERAHTGALLTGRKVACTPVSNCIRIMSTQCTPAYERRHTAYEPPYEFGRTRFDDLVESAAMLVTACSCWRRRDGL